MTAYVPRIDTDAVVAGEHLFRGGRRLVIHCGREDLDARQRVAQ
jgi:hypothetical protein